jgi:salicylate hydroxylase
MTSSTTNEAALSLKFVVVGGGIAGLATAFALQRAGHSVLVLEKRDPNSMGFGAGGGIRAPPNMTRLLYRWGLGPMLREKGTRCNRITYVNGNSAGMLGAILFNEAFIKALIADMILIQHGDLLNILYDLALREGVEIRHNANVVHTDPDCATVRLDTGETLSGDIIVLADGFTSSLRFNVTGYCQDAGLESHEQVLLVAFTVDTKLLQDDESFKPVLDPTQWMTWIAEDNILHTYIVNGGELLIGALSHDYSGPLREGDEEWREDRDLASYGLDFSALEPRMQKNV